MSKPKMPDAWTSNVCPDCGHRLLICVYGRGREMKFELSSVEPEPSSSSEPAGSKASLGGARRREAGEPRHKAALRGPERAAKKQKAGTGTPHKASRKQP
jgi:hypothetical protein